MKRFLIGLVLVCGCSLHEDYVRQDRANYETLRPVIEALQKAAPDLYDDDFDADITDRLNGWDAKTTQALEMFDNE